MRQLEARAVIQLGLGLLIATPVARVVFSLFAFIRQRDAMYVVITSIALTVLLLGLFSARSSAAIPHPQNSFRNPAAEGMARNLFRGSHPVAPDSHGPACAARIFFPCATSHSGRRFG